MDLLIDFTDPDTSNLHLQDLTPKDFIGKSGLQEKGDLCRSLIKYTLSHSFHFHRHAMEFRTEIAMGADG